MDVKAALELPDETDAFLQISDILYGKISSSGYESLSTSEKYFYCIDGLIRGMGSGGISHFFYDEAGIHAEDAIKGLEAARATRIQKVVQDALDCFPGKQVPADEEAREELVSDLEEQHSDLWAAISDRFFDSETELVKLTLKFVSKNLADFR